MKSHTLGNTPAMFFPRPISAPKIAFDFSDHHQTTAVEWLLQPVGLSSAPKRILLGASADNTNVTSLSCGAIDVALVSEQRHKAALHMIVFVRRAVDVSHLTAKPSGDHAVGYGNAADSAETEKVVATTDGPALGPF